VTDAELDRLRADCADDLEPPVDEPEDLPVGVGAIRAHKRALGLPFLDPGQEERLLARLRDENGGPLSAEGVERLFREILDLVKHELES